MVSEKKKDSWREEQILIEYVLLNKKIAKNYWMNNKWKFVEIISFKNKIKISSSN